MDKYRSGSRPISSTHTIHVFREKRQHQNSDIGSPIGETDKDSTTNSSEVLEEAVFDSLDDVLTKARKRPMVMTLLPYQIQALMNKPIVRISLLSNNTTNMPKSVLSIGDLFLILIAWKLNSVGFAIGYIVGKLSTPVLRETKILPVALVELWTVIVAIASDVVWSNM